MLDLSPSFAGTTGLFWYERLCAGLLARWTSMPWLPKTPGTTGYGRNRAARKGRLLVLVDPNLHDHFVPPRLAPLVAWFWQRITNISVWRQETLFGEYDQWYWEWVQHTNLGGGQELASTTWFRRGLDPNWNCAGVGAARWPIPLAVRSLVRANGNFVTTGFGIWHQRRSRLP
jgi:hypothetical protein